MVANSVVLGNGGLRGLERCHGAQHLQTPFHLQTNSLFGGSAAGPSNPGTFGPVGIGSVPRHVNIHIHTAVGPRASNAGVPGERVNPTGSGDSGQTRVPTVRNVTGSIGVSCSTFGSSLGAFTVGIWSENHDVLGVANDDMLYFIKANGEEITRITKRNLKVSSSIVGLIAPDDFDMNKSCLCSFNVLTSDGSLHEVEISQHPSASIFSACTSNNRSTLKEFPENIFCLNYHPDISLLAIVGAVVSVPVTSSGIIRTALHFISFCFLFSILLISTFANLPSRSILLLMKTLLLLHLNLSSRSRKILGFGLLGGADRDAWGAGYMCWFWGADLGFLLGMLTFMILSFMLGMLVFGRCHAFKWVGLTWLIGFLVDMLLHCFGFGSLLEVSEGCWGTLLGVYRG
ncbi:hypothetical protein U1Q18_045201 [Sarracenia purpurea var. burkii]